MTGKRKDRPNKEAYFVQIQGADDAPMFVNVSAQLGKPLAVTTPLATVLVSVHDDQVLFSALKLHKRTRELLKKQPLAFRQGPISALQRRGAAFQAAHAEEPIGDDAVVVDFDGTQYPLVLKRADGGATLDTPVDVEDTVVDLPRSPVKVQLFLRSPRTGRLLVVGWEGYVGKPGAPETLVRIASQALAHLTGLVEFQVLSGITSVRVPAPPGKFQLAAPSRSSADKVEHVIPVRLWTDSVPPAGVAAGNVKVVVDLDSANPATAQLLYHYSPEESLAAHLVDGYRQQLDYAVSAAFAKHFDHDEITTLACDITLGELEAGGIMRLQEAVRSLPGFDLAPSQWAPFA